MMTPATMPVIASVRSRGRMRRPDQRRDLKDGLEEEREVVLSGYQHLYGIRIDAYGFGGGGATYKVLDRTNENTDDGRFVAKKFEWHNWVTRKVFLGEVEEYGHQAAEYDEADHSG